MMDPVPLDSVDYLIAMLYQYMYNKDIRLDNDFSVYFDFHSFYFLSAFFCPFWTPNEKTEPVKGHL